MTSADRPELLWSPTAASHEHSAMARFRDFVNRRNGLKLDGYEQLWTWSVTDTAVFWAAVWDFFEIGDRDGSRDVLVGGPMPNYHWFPGTTVNFAEYLLSQGDDTEQAILTVDETGAADWMDRRELRRQVGALAATLRAVGVRRGDVVAGYLPNTSHAVVAFAATASLGAVWASVGQDYAPGAVVSRLGQLAPVALITADGYRFNGRVHARTDAVEEIRTAVPTIAHTIIVNRIGEAAPGRGRQLWDDAVAGTAAIDPVATDFSDPLSVLFSSGTTGTPKGLVHSHGGVLLEMLTMVGLHMDVGPGDRYFWYTSPSWMMWNVLVGALTTGASIVCYEGAPTHPDPAAMWRLIADHNVTFFGTSPGFLQSCAAAGVCPGNYDLSALREMGSTGSPLPANVHRWAHEHLGDTRLNSSSGGTDVVGAFLLGAPEVPVWAGELSARALGVRVEAWDATGRPVPAGEVGELVVTRPMPSMPLRFWNDPDGKRYRDAYFATYPHVWRHGDWVTITDRGSAVLHGRSDATLNRNGVRMGSGDIYAVVEAVTGVEEALVVGIERSDGSYWMPIFVVPRAGYAVDDELKSRLVDAIRRDLSPRHVPDEIIEVAGIPHTKTGKKLEVPVKKILLGADPASVVVGAAVDCPALLDRFAELRLTGSMSTSRI